MFPWQLCRPNQYPATPWKSTGPKLSDFKQRIFLFFSSPLLYGSPTRPAPVTGAHGLFTGGPNPGLFQSGVPYPLLSLKHIAIKHSRPNSPPSIRFCVTIWLLFGVRFVSLGRVRAWKCAQICNVFQQYIYNVFRNHFQNSLNPDFKQCCLCAQVTPKSWLKFFKAIFLHKCTQLAWGYPYILGLFFWVQKSLLTVLLFNI